MRMGPNLATDGAATLLSFFFNPRLLFFWVRQGQTRLPIYLTYLPPSCQLILHISGAWLYNI